MEIDKKDILDLDEPLMQIGVVAEMLEISVHTLRLYESEGLVLPYKKDSKHRLYSHNDVIRLRCIRDSIINKKFSIAAIKTLYSMIPCWAIMNCPEEDRNNCNAYNLTLNPCWTYKHKSNICAAKECRTCNVYQSHGDCASIKKSIKELIKINSRQA